jgi:hypothetical protein
MTGTAGPRHGLVWGYLPGESGWGVGGFNPNFAKLDALVHLTVIAVAATPPATPVNGDCYIVAASPTGAWVGHADDIAVYYTAGGWLYIDPAVGVRAFDRSADLYVRFDGVDWIDEIAPAADVAGPVSSVDGHIAVYDGATGKVIKDGGKALPGGLVVGDSDEQVLTNKLIQGADNNLSVRLNADVVGNLPVAHLNGGAGASNTTVWHGDGTWRAPAGGGGGTSVTVSDVPPASPVAGQLWFDSETACMFVWFTDTSGTTSGQWVIAVNPGNSGGVGAGVTSITTGDGLTDSGPVGDVHVELNTPISVSEGGTAADRAEEALFNLGAAPIDSPVLCGVPTAPTASPGTNNGQIATTAFVQNEMIGISEVSSVTAGVGLTGGGMGDVVVALEVPVSPSHGGTGFVSYAMGDVLFGNAQGVLERLPASPQPGRYLSNAGPGNGPAWSPVDLISGVAGMLPIGSGGTAAADPAGARLNLGAASIANPVFTGNATISGTLGISSNAINTLTVSRNAASPPATYGDTVVRVIGGDGSGPRLLLDSYGTNALVTMRRADGTGAAPTAVKSGETLGSYAVVGRGATDYSTAVRAWLRFIAAENWTDTAQGTSVELATTINGGTSTAARVVIDGTGKFITKTPVNALSDASLKQDVAPFERGLEAICALRPVTFRYRAGTPFAPDEASETLIGLLAEEVAEHIPEVCGTTVAMVDDEERECAVLATTDLTFALINAVRTLAERVRELESGR